jgi:SAM-dependent methyltransferase
VQPSFVENSHGRHSDDFYRTPGEVTAALCDELVLRGISPRTILDVGCGDGAIGIVLRQYFPKAWIVGIEPNHHRWSLARRSTVDDGPTYNAVDQVDWLDVANDSRDWTRLGPLQAPDMIVFNSPFKLALPFKQRALKRVARGGLVASLLISQWDQETVHDDERGRFLDSLRKPDGSEGYGKLRWKGRVDFRGNGKTDRVSHEWLVIGPGFEGQFVRVPRSPVATHEQLGLFGKGTTL